MKGMYKYPNDPSLTGHFMVAINVEAILGREEMQARMAEFTDSIKTSPMWDEGREMLLPGEIEYLTTLARQKEGIPLPPKLYEELLELGRELGATIEP
jgi:LDH2 family malate/lactate/ureidoglycolate dehydrogenase